MIPKKLGPSEFEGRGPWPFGGFGLSNAWEKLRYAMRTGRNPDDEGADHNAPADNYPDKEAGAELFE